MHHSVAAALHRQRRSTRGSPSIRRVTPASRHRCASRRWSCHATAERRGCWCRRTWQPQYRPWNCLPCLENPAYLSLTGIRPRSGSAGHKPSCRGTGRLRRSRKYRRRSGADAACLTPQSPAPCATPRPAPGSAPAHQPSQSTAAESPAPPAASGPASDFPWSDWSRQNAKPAP